MAAVRADLSKRLVPDGLWCRGLVQLLENQRICAAVSQAGVFAGRTSARLGFCAGSVSQHSYVSLSRPAKPQLSSLMAAQFH